MKKVLFILGAVCIIALSSCSKEKDCECVTSYSGDGSELFDDITASMTIEDGDCSDGDSSVTTNGLTATTTCTEK